MARKCSPGSKDVNWDAFNWAGAKVKLICDGWVNEFVVEDSGASAEHVIQDKVTFDVMFAANMTVEKSLNVEYSENSNDYLSGLVLCLWQPIDTFGRSYPFFCRPSDEVVKAYETYMATQESVPDTHLYRLGDSTNNEGNRSYSFMDVLSQGEYGEYGLPDADILSMNGGFPRSRHILWSALFKS